MKGASKGERKQIRKKKNRMEMERERGLALFRQPQLATNPEEKQSTRRKNGRWKKIKEY